MRRLIFRVVFGLLVYFTSVWTIGRVVSGLAYVTSISGAPGLWQILHQHPYGRSIAVGLVAGSIPFQLWLSVSGHFSSNLPEFFRKLELDSMKRWVVLLISPIMVLALVHWIVSWSDMHSRQVTVLSGDSSMPYWSIFDGFFSTECRNASDARLDVWGENFMYQCLVHVQLIAAFLTAVGYSLAPWISAHIPRNSMATDPGPIDELPGESASESKMTENIEEQ
jgi:hypothetical protein